jgi:hypothetical protein
MATHNAVTKTRNIASQSRRTAFEAQPLPRKRARSRTATERNKEENRGAWADARRAVEWLNASHEGDARQRVVFVRDELATLPRDWAIHNTQHPCTHPKFRQGWDQDERRLDKRHRALNKLLSTYAFRPRVTHRIGAGWAFGLVPDILVGEISMKTNRETTSEADAVMCLFRLAETGDLAKIRRCNVCEKHLFFAAKRSYRFCSDECREMFYAKAPDYHDRKAKNQREYRERLKRAEVGNLA